MKLTEQHLKDYSNYLDNLKLNPITSKKYRLYLNHFVSMFDYLLTQKFMDNFLTLKTSPNHRSMMKHLLDFLKRDDKLTQEEQLEISRLVILKQTGKKPRQEKPTLSKIQIAKLIEDGKVLGNSFKTSIFKLMILFQYEMGLRISELCQLKFSILKQGENLESGYLKIYLPPEITKFSKGGNAYVQKKYISQYKAFLEEVAKLRPNDVLGIIEDKKTLWFDLSSTWFEKNFTKETMRILGIKRTSHTLRHSRATHLLQEGVPIEQVQKFLRHEGIESTEVYLHQIDTSLEKSLSGLQGKSKEKIDEAKN